MAQIKVLHYDAFTNEPYMGNPAGVVLDADELTHDEMQDIAKKVGFNETVFVLRSENADLRLKYYTPGHEINLCGHATIASLHCLKSRGLLKDSNSIEIETNVGILPIEFQSDHDFSIRMKQDHPKFEAFNGDIDRLFQSMNLSIEDWDSDLPIVYGSTGTWTLLIPVKSLDCFSKMKPFNRQFPTLLKENPKASIHPFCLDTYDNQAFMHARHFSSPYSGTVEDPVTGTASGVMGAYYLAYVKPEQKEIEFIVEQGQEINKDGRVKVEVKKVQGDRMEVFISGQAVFVEELYIKV